MRADGDGWMDCDDGGSDCGSDAQWQRRLRQRAVAMLDSGSDDGNFAATGVEVGPPPIGPAECVR